MAQLFATDPQGGRLFLDREKFHAAFAADLNSEEAAFMADSQAPWGVDALRGTIGKAAWRTKPSWYLVASEDRMIPPAAQRLMATRAGATMIEEKGSHAIYVSQPKAVAALIAKAASGVKVAPAGSEEAEEGALRDGGRGKELDADRHAGA
jgi:pimeloyl-ACP methyl ester carboxylesterase